MAKSKESEETTNASTPEPADTAPVSSDTAPDSPDQWSYAELARFQLTGEKPVR
jgi:hypothetical protein